MTLKGAHAVNGVIVRWTRGAQLPEGVRVRVEPADDALFPPPEPEEHADAMIMRSRTRPAGGE